MSDASRKLSPAFNAASDFAAYMDRQMLGDETLQKVVAVLEGLELRVPEKEEEFLKATNGVLLFSNYYGVTVRIEESHPFDGRLSRLSDYPLMIKPIAHFDAGGAIVEICPGTHNANRRYYVDFLWRVMREDGIDFFDEAIHNVGLLPVKAPRFSEGIPVVIDRLSAATMPFSDIKNEDRLSHALKAIKCTEDPQKIYAPLQEAFQKAWPKESLSPDPESMKKCWNLCRAFKEEGKLVDGWNEDRYSQYKLLEARSAAQAYDKAMGL